VSDHSALERIRKVVADVTHSRLEDVDENTSPETLGSWDSVAQINVIIGIENEFGVSFDVEEMYALNSVRKIQSALADRLDKAETQSDMSRRQ
jgi:acyl carrier protein